MNIICVLLGMCESIIAAALSRIGWRVLHLDRLNIRKCAHVMFSKSCMHMSSVLVNS